MQADVVSRKFCKQDYNCPECHYDRIMQSIAEENKEMKLSGIIPRGKRGRIISWQEKLRARALSQRPCIHHMKGRIEFRLCHNEYRCGNCDFGQFFDDQYSVHAVVRPVDELDIKGFKIPQGYYIHHGHTWIKIEEGSSVRVGIDDFALRLLGPLDRIETPLIGREIKQDRADITLSRGENTANVLSPVSGVVTSINSKLREEGSLANQNPYSDGWLMIVKPDSLRRDLKNLMIHKETGDFMGAQVDLLYQEIEDAAGPLATDGGLLGDDIYGNMPQFDWKRLTNIFLKT
jgi:glycine cleavage system H lipoate-binding protein